MSEIIYILTVIYFGFVVNEVEGERIKAFIQDVLHVDLSRLHSAYTNLRDRLINSINTKKVNLA